MNFEEDFVYAIPQSILKRLDDIYEKNMEINDDLRNLCLDIFSNHNIKEMMEEMKIMEEEIKNRLRS